MTCDPMPTSRQLAASCLSSLLRIRAKVTNRVIESGDIESLCEGLNSCSTASQLQTSSKIAWVPQILQMLQSCMLSLQQSTFMPFLSLAVVILIRHHPEAMLDSFRQQLEPRDSHNPASFKLPKADSDSSESQTWVAVKKPKADAAWINKKAKKERVWLFRTRGSLILD
ncbi:UNVERIFIED_CONTAM: hypothetical protein H355_001565 [Colinus virginianus]|nr:hypothetical protein H355_001565 [Colinus virginianus]